MWETGAPAGRPPRHLYRLTARGREYASEHASAPAATPARRGTAAAREVPDRRPLHPRAGRPRRGAERSAGCGARPDRCAPKPAGTAPLARSRWQSAACLPNARTGETRCAPSSPACAAPALAGASASAARGRLSRCGCEPPRWLAIVAAAACAPRCWRRSPRASCSALFGLVRYPGLRSGSTAGLAFAAFLAIMLAYGVAALSLSRGRAPARRDRARRCGVAGGLAVGGGWLLHLRSGEISKSFVFVPLGRRARRADRGRGARGALEPRRPGGRGRRRSGAGWSAACSCSSSGSRPRTRATVGRTTPRLVRDFHASGSRDLADVRRRRRSRRRAQDCS